PVTMGPKGLLNGPCSGTRHGMCEVEHDKPCAWRMIYERLGQTGRLEQIKEIAPPQRHGKRTTPAHMVHKAYKRRLTAND
ncbi:MAG: hypothetical protein GY849_07940, partial [Deltaproteobacteria bacterium]|nr:hypothetical protein [Deltaproteobacteria bacterium]